MRHGHVRRESLLYVVVAATRPTYCGVLVAALVWLTWAFVCLPNAGAAQRPRKKVPPPPPFAALFPLEEAWSIVLPAPPARPAIRQGAHVIVPLASGVLIALRWDTGDTVWSVPLRATSSPVAHDDTIYIGDGDTLHALDAASGASRFTARAGGTLQALTLSGTRVLAAGAGFANAFDAGSGQVVWSRTLPAAGDVTGLVASSTTLVATYGEGRINALAVADGRELWARPVGAQPSPPLLLEDSVYVGDRDRRFYSLDVRNGKERWSWRTGGDVTGAAADATPKSNAVFYTSLDAVVRAVNAGNGHQRWKTDGGTRAPVPPIGLDGSLLVTGLTPSLSAFNPKDGRPLGTFEFPGEVFGLPLVRETLAPRAVSIVVVLKDGRAMGAHSVALHFNESPPQPFLELPGTPLTRERLPDPPAPEPAPVPSGPGR
jgi:outer membrane protein assembly factor BamB